MIKHTPGPWKYYYEGSGDYLILAGDDEKEIASVLQPKGGSGFLGGGPAEENEANAKFIVLACNSHYELLEACKAALPMIKRSVAPMTYSKVSAAIAKAEGRA